MKRLSPLCGQLKSLLLMFDEAAASLLERMLNKYRLLGWMSWNAALEELGNMMLAIFSLPSRVFGLYQADDSTDHRYGGAITGNIGATDRTTIALTTDIVESVGGAQGHILILPEARQQVLLKALGVGRGMNLSAPIRVSMADSKVAKAPSQLITTGLSSCVGVALYDPVAKWQDLPISCCQIPTRASQLKPGKFADTAIQLIAEMEKAGAKSRLTANRRWCPNV